MLAFGYSLQLFELCYLLIHCVFKTHPGLVLLHTGCPNNSICNAQKLSFKVLNFSYPDRGRVNLPEGYLFFSRFNTHRTHETSSIVLFHVIQAKVARTIIL